MKKKLPEIKFLSSFKVGTIFFDKREKCVFYCRGGDHKNRCNKHPIVNILKFFFLEKQCLIIKLQNTKAENPPEIFLIFGLAMLVTILK